jgi:ribosome recycling factor
MSAESILAEARDKMDKTISSMERELAGIRAGKATPALLDSIRVDYYGSIVPLQQVASVNVPEARLIVIQPWEKNMVAPISKAIQAADLGLNPTDDGTVVRVPIPPLTEERRKDLVKVVKRIGEDSRVAVRNVRRDANEKIKKLEKEHELSEDVMRNKQDAIQKLTDQFVHKVDEAVAAKEKEILEI